MKKIAAAAALALATGAALLGAAPAHAAPAPDTSYPLNCFGSGTSGQFKVINGGANIQVSIDSNSRAHLTTQVEGNVAGAQNFYANTPYDTTNMFDIKPVQQGWNVLRVKDSNGSLVCDAVAWRP